MYRAFHQKPRLDQMYSMIPANVMNPTPNFQHNKAAANISKNRYGITEDLIVTAGQNPLINLIPSIGP